MPVPHVPPEHLAAALAHLEQASQAASGSSRISQQSGSRDVFLWKRQIGTSPSALVYARHVLETTRDPAAAFHACTVLGAAAPRCFLSGRISGEEAWEVWRWMIGYALATTGAPQAMRFIARRMVELLSAFTKAGWTAEVDGRGWTAQQRHSILEQAVGLLADPQQQGGRANAAVETGLRFAAAMANDFALFDPSGELKARSQPGRQPLAWADEVKAQQDFEAYLLPPLLRATLETLSRALDHGDRPTLGKAFATLSELLGWRSEDLSKIDPSLTDDPDSSVGASPQAGSSSQFHARSDLGNFQPSPFPSSCLGFLDDPVLHLIHRAHGILWAAVVDRPASDGFADGGSIDEEALLHCEACVLSLICASPGLEWPQDRRAPWRSSTRVLVQLLFERLQALEDPARRYGAAFSDRLAFFSNALKACVAASSSASLSDVLAAWSGGSDSPEQGLGQLLSALLVVGEATSHMMVLPAKINDEMALDDADTVDQEAARVFEGVAGVVADLHLQCSPHPAGAQLAHMTAQAGAQMALAFVNAKLESCRTRSYLADAKAAAEGFVEDQDVAIGLQDRVAYAEVLVALSQLARLDVWTVLSHLHHTLGALSAEVLAGVKAHGIESVKVAQAKERDLHAACEALHWAVLFAGSFLADDGEGETPVVPDAINQMSEQLAKEGRAEVDPAVRLPLEVYQLLHETTFGQNDPEVERCSPQVAETLIWFCGRWALSYLLTDPTVSGPLSTSLSARYSGQAGFSLLDHLLSSLARNLHQWSGDVSVLSQIADSLSRLGRSSSLTRQITRCSGFESLLNVSLSTADVLPQDVVGPLVCAVLKCLSSSLSTPEGHRYFSAVLSAVEQRMSGVLKAAAARGGDLQRPDSLARLSSSLDMYLGLAASVQPFTAAPTLAVMQRTAPNLRGLWQAAAKQQASVEIAIWKVYAALAEVLGQGVLEGGGKEGDLPEVIVEVGRLGEVFGACYAGGRGVTLEGELREELGIVLATMGSFSAACSSESGLQEVLAPAIARLLIAILPILALYPGWLAIPAFGKTAVSALSTSFTPMVLHALLVVAPSRGVALAGALHAILDVAIKSAMNEVVEGALGSCWALARSFEGAGEASSEVAPYLLELLDPLVISVIRSLLVLPHSKPLTSQFVATLHTLVHLRGSSPHLQHVLHSTPLAPPAAASDERDWMSSDRDEGRIRAALDALWKVLTDPSAATAGSQNRWGMNGHSIAAPQEGGLGRQAMQAALKIVRSTREANRE